MHANMIKISIAIILLFFLLPSPFTASQQGEGGSMMVDEMFKENNEKEKPATTEKDQTESFKDTEMVNQTSVPTVTLWDFVKMIFALGFVLLLIYCALRFINKRNKWFDNGRSVENIGGTNLGNNKSLQLVKVGNSILVVGVGDSINLLKEITDEKEAELLLEAYQNKTDAAPLTKETFKEWMNKLPLNKSTGNTNQFSSLLKEQIGQLSQDRKKKISELDEKEGRGQ
ncbi:flagellar protein FliO/FliZ [Bacillus tianshenii]|uniref:Flagellar protein FliO/FliZ n=1 Tax=Sutcliffiella tianshenii TaxID=1463404 RepID=A0ABS2NWJ7_9BACI|nr:flagellar biosynthetic protein FliO [Bacillus tianshenii]MBM7618999.1 flagellar protein FliO/FliZ [Bacillus tianshenii]